MPIENFHQIEFGIAYVQDNQLIARRIPIDDSVRENLAEMHDNFYTTYFGIVDEEEVFSTSEKYSNTEKLYVSNHYPGTEKVYSIYNEANIPVESADISDLVQITEFYFAIYHFVNGTKHLAIRRPSTFKGLLKKRLFSFADDTLRAVEDDVFKLDSEFDFIIHHNRIDILHPFGFVFINDIDNQILDAAVNIANGLNQRINFIGFQFISEKIGRSKTCARLIASINAREDLEFTDMNKLITLCTGLGIVFRQEDGLYVPDEKHIEDFLRVLDRREYEVNVTSEPAEIYIAGSRKKK